MARRRRGHRRGPVAAAADPLSSLPDELLRRILFFAPAKDAASTCVLSRRWRSLWRTSGAVNLDTRSYAPQLRHYFDAGRIVRRRFIRGAKAALAAAHGGPVTRLTVHVEAVSAHDQGVGAFLNTRRFRAVFSHPAAKRVEELRVAVVPAKPLCRGDLYKLSFRKLPSDALTALHVTGFTHLKPPESGAAFPRLNHLHLQRCIVSFSRLQRIIDASPELATLHLESSSFPGVDNVPKARRNSKFSRGWEPCYRLVCPTVTTLVFAQCNGSMPCLEGSLEIKAPRLRSFRYHGILVVKDQLLLRVLGMSKLFEADLHISGNTSMEKPIHVPFWEFVHDFSAARVLRLKIGFAIDRIAIVDNKGQVDLRGKRLFHNLKCLELEGRYEPSSRTAALTIANFLHCCPVVRDLHLKLKMSPLPLHLRSVGTQAQLDFNECLGRFKRRRRAMVLLGGDDDRNMDNCEVSEIHGLSEHSFNCLQSSLRRVRLQIWMQDPNCFAVQLAKFFADNAVLLEEMQIDDGNHKMHEHMNSMVRRWISKRRNSLNVTSFGDSYHPCKRLKG